MHKQQKNFPNIEFDSKFFKVKPNENDLTFKSKPEKEMTPVFKKSFFENPKSKNNFSETIRADKIQGNNSINSFPQSAIGIKRATTPLLRSQADTPDQTTLINRREKTESNASPFYPNRNPKKYEETELDKTPPLLNPDLEVEISKNFERARMIHKSYVGTISNLKNEKYSVYSDSSKQIKTLLLEEPSIGSTHLFPPNERSPFRSATFKTLNLGSKLSSNTKNQQDLSNIEKTIETDRLSSNRGYETEYRNLQNPNGLKNPYINSMTSSTTNFSLKAQFSSPNGKTFQKQKEQGNIQSQPLFQRLLKFNFYKRTKCTCDSNLKENETCSKAIGWILNKYKKSEFESLKKTYEKILKENQLQNQEIVKQIQKDMNRTYPSTTYFAADGEG